MIVETTRPGWHSMPLSVTLRGFKPYAGEFSSGPKQRVRMTLVETSSAAGTVVDQSPKPGALGPCEEPPKEGYWK